MKKSFYPTHFFFLLLLLSLLAVGCGRQEAVQPTDGPAVAEQADTPTTAPPTDTPVPPTDTPAPTATATNTPEPTATATATPTPSPQELAEAATVRIVVEGSPFLETYIGFGSGVIIDPAGLVLTNYHLVEGAGIIQVTLADGTAVPAQLLGRSACADVAVLQLLGNALPALPLGADPAGETLIAAGYPTQTDPVQTVEVTAGSDVLTGTLGFVAAMSQTLPLETVLEPGFTGGPLVSPAGEIAGLLSLGPDDTAAYVIPASALAALADALAGGENVDWLGLNVGPAPAGLAEDENFTGEVVDGLFIYAVDLRGPAGQAGLRAGDFLTEFAGEELAGPGALEHYCRLVQAQPAAEPLDVAVVRGGDNFVGQINGDPLVQEEEVVEVPVATAAPPPPAATAAPPAGGNLLEAATTARNEMQGLGGFLDGLIAGGCLQNNPGDYGGLSVPGHVSCIHQPGDCQRVIDTTARIVNSPTFAPEALAPEAQGAYGQYRSAISAFDSGTTQLISACEGLIANPDASVSNLVVAVARQNIGQAIEIMNRAIEALEA